MKKKEKLITNKERQAEKEVEKTQERALEIEKGIKTPSEVVKELEEK